MSSDYNPTLTDRCPRCDHKWHGLLCLAGACECETAWELPEGDS